MKIFRLHNFALRIAIYLWFWLEIEGQNSSDEANAKNELHKSEDTLIWRGVGASQARYNGM